MGEHSKINIIHWFKSYGGIVAEETAHFCAANAPWLRHGLLYCKYDVPSNIYDMTEGCHYGNLCYDYKRVESWLEANKEILLASFDDQGHIGRFHISNDKVMHSLFRE